MRIVRRILVTLAGVAGLVAIAAAPAAAGVALNHARPAELDG
jgi:hypothetical protein